MSSIHFSDDRNIDMVFCIDCSAGMDDHLDTVREKVKSFYMEYIMYFTERGSCIQSCRCKVIGFRNYETDGQDAMFQSRWFDISEVEDTAEFDTFLSSLRGWGGGDERNSGLEALYCAMTTDWDTRNSRDRQIIVLFSNTDAVPLCTCRDQPDYPASSVDMQEFLGVWHCKKDGHFNLNERAKRLVMIAPGKSIYEYDLLRNMNRSFFSPFRDDTGFSAINWNDFF